MNFIELKSPPTSYFHAEILESITKTISEIKKKYPDTLQWCEEVQTQINNKSETSMAKIAQNIYELLFNNNDLEINQKTKDIINNCNRSLKKTDCPFQKLSDLYLRIDEVGCEYNNNMTNVPLLQKICATITKKDIQSISKIINDNIIPNLSDKIKIKLTKSKRVTFTHKDMDCLQQLKDYLQKNIKTDFSCSEVVEFKGYYIYQLMTNPKETLTLLEKLKMSGVSHSFTRIQ